MKKTYIKNIIISILYIFISIPPLHAFNVFKPYEKLFNLSQKELLEKGKKYIKEEHMDSALVCFTLVSKENQIQNKSTADLELCCEAYYQKWYILFSHNFDYSEAYRNINTLIRIRDNNNIYFPKGDIGLAIFYHILYMQSKSKNLEYKAIDACQKAFNTALKKNDRKMMGTSIINLQIMASNLRDISIIEELWSDYESDKDSSFSYKYNALFYQYLRLWINKKYKEAIPVAEEMLEISSANEDWRRMFSAYMNLYYLYRDQGQYEKALDYVLKNEKLTEEKKLKEDALELCEIKSELYFLLGRREEGNYYKMKYLLQKDSLLNFKQMENINKIAFSTQINNMEEELAKVMFEKKANVKVLFFVIIFSIILLVLSILLYIKVIQLKKTNFKIYENSLQNIKYEQLQEKYLKCQKNEETEEAVEIEEANNNKEKYKTNKISENEKKLILEKIIDVMNNLDEICSTSFSGKRLAELTGTSYNYISLVINENYNCDFNSFLNKYRVQEACKRFSDEKNYGNLTIEAISESLGFKSKTTLVNSFKKIVGLTPSQYRKIVREKNQ